MLLKNHSVKKERERCSLSYLAKSRSRGEKEKKMGEKRRNLSKKNSGPGTYNNLPMTPSFSVSPTFGGVFPPNPI